MSDLQQDVKRILPFCVAISDGKTVEIKFGTKHWHEVDCLADLIRDFPLRIKPEKKWRPYTREEWESITRVRSKAHGVAHLVLVVHDDYIEANNNSYTFEMAMRVFTNLDGSPCGVEIEHE